MSWDALRDLKAKSDLHAPRHGAPPLYRYYSGTNTLDLRAREAHGVVKDFQLDQQLRRPGMSQNALEVLVPCPFAGVTTGNLAREWAKT